MKTYNEFVKLVRNWANRDEEVLSNAIIADCLTYAADKAYRTLRVPPLETTVTYDSTELTAATTTGPPSFTELAIPSNLIEFIQIRSIAADGATKRVFNEKSDVRTFFDTYAEKYNTSAYWTRKGNNILLSPGFNTSNVSGTEDKVELYYYRRLPALNARYDVTATNANLSETFISEITESNPAPTDLKTGQVVSTASLKKAVYTRTSDNQVITTTYYETSVADSSIPDAPVGQTRAITTASYYGSEVPNWLRDENERIILNGALAEAFIYLNEPESVQMYGQIFTSEIDELNREESKRHSSGGNVQININTNGLI